MNTEKGIVVDKTKKDDTELCLELRNKEPIHDIVCTSLIEYGNEYMKRQPVVDKIASWTFAPYYNIQKYNPGQGYHISHCENAGGLSLMRVLSWMIYLNTVNDEGETSFDNYNMKTSAVEGSLLIWPAFWTHFHHGIMSSTETKYIATGWCSYADSILESLIKSRYINN